MTLTRVQLEKNRRYCKVCGMWVASNYWGRWVMRHVGVAYDTKTGAWYCRIHSWDGREGQPPWSG